MNQQSSPQQQAAGRFIYALPNNSRRAKRAFFTMLIAILICSAGVALSVIYWDDYTHQVWLRGRMVTKGWPATLYSWGLWLGTGLLIFLPILYFMQDWKQPSLAITEEGLFINQQMIRKVIVPFSNILKVEKTAAGHVIRFGDNEPILHKAGLFKPFIKYNLEHEGLVIDDTHSAGDIAAFLRLLGGYINAPYFQF